MDGWAGCLLSTAADALACCTFVLASVNLQQQHELAIASQLQSGEYQRWRLAWATSKRWASIGIVDKSGQPAPCEMLLVGKDAVYLMEVRWTWNRLGRVAETADGVNSLACTLLACTLLACTLLASTLLACTLLLADLVLADGMARGCCVCACSPHLLPTRDADPPQGVTRLPGGRQPRRDAGQVSCCGLQQRWTACSASACLPLSHDSWGPAAAHATQNCCMDDGARAGCAASKFGPPPCAVLTLLFGSCNLRAGARAGRTASTSCGRRLQRRALSSAAPTRTAVATRLCRTWAPLRSRRCVSCCSGEYRLAAQCAAAALRGGHRLLSCAFRELPGQ